VILGVAIAFAIELFSFLFLALLLEFGIDLGVALLLVLVEALDKFFNVGDAIPAAVVRGRELLVGNIHFVFLGRVLLSIIESDWPVVVSLPDLHQNQAYPTDGRGNTT